jgi:hypothetical protein
MRGCGEDKAEAAPLQPLHSGLNRLILVKAMKERRKAVLLAVAVVGLVVLVVVLLAYELSPSPLRGSPPVEVLYDQTGLVYEDGVYYHKIVLRNYGSETVRVVVKVKTQLDYYAKTSAPVEICAGCVVTVRLCALTDCAQPPATQTLEQRAAMIDFLSHPEYLRVEYA